MNSLWIAASWAILPLTAEARLWGNERWAAWHDAGQHAELRRAAEHRLEQSPTDPQALVALSLVLAETGQRADERKAEQLARDCVAAHPGEASCQFALGQALGLAALRGGTLKALGAARSVRAALTRAVELDPTLFEARQLLVQFHLQVPAAAGGRSAEARQLAAQAPHPQASAVLRAWVAIADGHLDQAEQALAAPTTFVPELSPHARQAWLAVAQAHFRAERFEPAKRLFDRALALWPQHAGAAYGLARVWRAEGRLNEAITLFERASTLEGAARLPIDHRLGEALAARGDTVQARKVLQRFIDGDRVRRVNERNLEDARSLLAKLG